MQMQPTEPNEKTADDIRAEVKRLRLDLWHRGLYFLAGAALILLDVFVLLVFWNWFVVPLGGRRLNYGLAWGLWLLMRFVISPTPPLVDKPGEWPEDSKRVWPFMFKVYSIRLILLAIGALIYVFLGIG